MFPDPQRGGELASNVLHFARVLRRAGMPIGTDRPLLAIGALQLAGLDSRADLHAVLRACLIDRREHGALFDQAFHIFWRNPDRLDEILRLLLPPAPAPGRSTRAPARRLNAALSAQSARLTAASPSRRYARNQSSSSEERLRKTDFDSMTAEEWRAAQRIAGQLALALRRPPARRKAPASTGVRLDLRQLLRDSARTGGEIVNFPRQQPRRHPEPLVALIDISGSMASYSRMFLQFVHAAANGESDFHAFVFGTRLTPITRQLRSWDPDVALARVVARVADWSGGTRIGACLKDFNRHWVRRLPLGEATVLLVTDGLEQGPVELIASEAGRLGRSCSRLLWLNPLLRYAEFEPRARGVQALLPHVTALLPVHDLEALERLTRALRQPQALEEFAWN